MAEWEMWGRDHISLDVLACALGIKSPKDDLDGSNVYDYYTEGRESAIYQYCLKDVKATQEIYNKMNFIE